MATCTGFNDPSLALEQNLKCLASNLFDLVDTDEGVSLSPISATNSNTSMDTYNSSVFDAPPFHGSPEFVDFESQAPQTFDTVGHFSDSSSQLLLGTTSTPLPGPPPGYYPLPYNAAAPNHVVVPQMHGFNAIQLPTATLVPMNSPVSYFQTVMVPGVQTFPFAQSSVFGNTVRNVQSNCNWQGSSVSLSEDDSYEYQQRPNLRRGYSFHKKYPRRSERDFMIVPKIDRDGFDPENEMVIDLRKLKIGPDYLYQSEQTKLMNKFKKALGALSDLANERRDVQCLVGAASNDPNICYDFAKNISGFYQFSQHLKYIVKVAKEEQKLAEVIIQEMESVVTETKLDGRGNIVVDEMLKETNRLRQLETLTIIKGDELDVNRKPDEVEIVKRALDNFTSSVRNVAVDIWCLKVWYQGLDCGQSKSSALV